MKILIIYLIVINVIAVVLTVHDKLAAIRNRWRVKESALIIIAALGGSPAMLLTMLLIRHKIRHPKFMVGIPILMVLDAIFVVLLMHNVLGVL